MPKIFYIFHKRKLPITRNRSRKEARKKRPPRETLAKKAVLSTPHGRVKQTFNPVRTGGYPLRNIALSTSADGGYKDSPGRETCIPETEVRIPFS